MCSIDRSLYSVFPRTVSFAFYTDSRTTGWSSSTALRSSEGGNINTGIQDLMRPPHANGPLNAVRKMKWQTQCGSRVFRRESCAALAAAWS